MKDKMRETLAFQDLTKEEKERRGILGRLYGPCATITIPTRNGRFYSEALWEKVFSDDELVEELFKAGGIPMELDHPADRDETCSDRIAAMLPEPPKRDKDGHLICYCDIIDTPCGKIAYQLAKYGFKLGISSRGTGDIYEDGDGNEAVDPDTYDFKTFDLVLIPAVKDARLTMVESLDNDNKLKKALNECLNSASLEDRKVMEETLQQLNIDYQSEKSEDNIKTEKTSEEEVTEKDAAENDGAEEIVKNLQEALKSKVELETKLLSLQNDLAVSDTKVTKLEEELKRYKTLSIRLSDSVRQSKVQSEELSSLRENLQKLNKTIELQQRQIKQLTESSKQEKVKTNELNESLAKKDVRIESLQKKLNECQDEAKNSRQDEINDLKESLETEKKNFNSKIKVLEKKLQESKTSTNNYKKIAYNTINKYIEFRANMLGVSSNEIKNKLSESYTLNDVDNVCEEIQRQSINISKLPFNVSRGSKIRVTESKNDCLRPSNEDDVIDDSLLTLANLK